MRDHLDGLYVLDVPMVVSSGLVLVLVIVLDVVAAPRVALLVVTLNIEKVR